MSDAQVLEVARKARREAEQARSRHLDQLGRACVDLHRRGWTWEKIGQEMDVNLTTAYRWARPHLSTGEL